MVLVIVVVRALLLHRLPKRAFTVLWGVVLVRLLIPYTLPCPFSAYSLLSGIGAAEISAPSDNAAVPLVTDPNSGNTAPFEPNLDPSNAIIPKQDIPAENGSPFDIRTAVWLAGMAAFAVLFAVSYIRCRIRFRESLPVESSCIDQWLSEHRLRRMISVRQSDRIAAPLTYGVFRPIILLPKNYEKIDEDDLKFVLSHEYVHIRRFDAVFKLLLTAALCVHWFNPLVWAMYVIANKDIEISCDEAVITLLGETEKKRYAMTLIRMEEIKSGLAPLISHYSKNHIKERIVTIMKFKKTTTLAAAAAVFLAVGVTTAFATSAGSYSGETEPQTNSTSELKPDSKPSDDLSAGNDTPSLPTTIYIPERDTPATSDDTEKETPDVANAPKNKFFFLGWEDDDTEPVLPAKGYNGMTMYTDPDGTLCVYVYPLTEPYSSQPVASLQSTYTHEKIYDDYIVRW